MLLFYTTFCFVASSTQTFFVPYNFPGWLDCPADQYEKPCQIIDLLDAILGLIVLFCPGQQAASPFHLTALLQANILFNTGARRQMRSALVIGTCSPGLYSQQIHGGLPFSLSVPTPAYPDVQSINQSIHQSINQGLSLH